MKAVLTIETSSSLILEEGNLCCFCFWSLTNLEGNLGWVWLKRSGLFWLTALTSSAGNWVVMGGLGAGLEAVPTIQMRSGTNSTSVYSNATFYILSSELLMHFSHANFLEVIKMICPNNTRRVCEKDNHVFIPSSSLMASS